MTSKELRDMLISEMVSLEDSDVLQSVILRFDCALLVSLHKGKDGRRIALYRERPPRATAIRRNPTDDSLVVLGNEGEVVHVRSGPFNNRQLEFICQYLASDIEEHNVLIEPEGWLPEMDLG